MSLRAALCWLALACGLAACRPDVPGRGCKTNDDCFTQEVCADGTCAARGEAGGSEGEGGAGGAGGAGGVEVDASTP